MPGEVEEDVVECLTAIEALENEAEVFLELFGFTHDRALACLPRSTVLPSTRVYQWLTPP